MNASLVLEDFFSKPGIPPIIYILKSRSLWSPFSFFTIRKFSESPALSIGPFRKVQLKVTLYVVRKNKKPP